MDPEKTFHEAMLDIYRRAKKECRYTATYFLQMVTERGGVDAAKALLHTDTASDGFTTLWQHKRLDLSVEYHVLLPEFKPLFTPEERAIAQRRLAQYTFTDFPPEPDHSSGAQSDPTHASARPACGPDEAVRVARLIEFGRTVSSNDLVFTNEPLIGDLINNDPFGFLLAGSLDRGMVAETVWRLPAKIRAVLGHLDPAQIVKMTQADVLAVLQRIEGKPHYLTAACKTTVDVAQRVMNDCGGNARNLWDGQRPWVIKSRMETIHGVGPGIASMMVNLLARLGKIELEPGDYAAMDIKPDVHVRRVFQRLGLCGREPSEQEAVEAARRLHPEYPGELDAPAWHIGRTWCHASGPACTECPLGDICPKIV